MNKGSIIAILTCINVLLTGILALVILWEIGALSWMHWIMISITMCIFCVGVNYIKVLIGLGVSRESMSTSEKLQVALGKYSRSLRRQHD